MGVTQEWVTAAWTEVFTERRREAGGEIGSRCWQGHHAEEMNGCHMLLSTNEVLTSSPAHLWPGSLFILDPRGCRGLGPQLPW